MFRVLGLSLFFSRSLLSQLQVHFKKSQNTLNWNHNNHQLLASFGFLYARNLSMFHVLLYLLMDLKEDGAREFSWYSEGV